MAGFGIAGIAQTFSVATDANDAQERSISGSNSVNLGSFMGRQPFVLRFGFATEVSAPQHVGGADEAAARFGANGPLSGATADDDPGPGDVVDRNRTLDGHFVRVRATLLTIGPEVPEPGTVVLLGAGIAGLALRGRRRSKLRTECRD